MKNDRLLKQGLVDTNYYFLAQTGAKAVALLVLPIFARLLSLEQFASYDLFVIASGLLVILGSLGMDSGLAIKIAESKHEKNLLSAMLTTTIALSSGVIIVLWAAAALLQQWLPYMATFSTIYLHGLFVYTFIYQYNYNIYNFTRWLGNARMAAVISFASSVLGIVCGLVSIILFQPKVEYYILGAIVGSMIGAVFSTFSARHYLLWRRLPSAHLKDLMKLSIPYLPTYFSNYLMQLTDRLIITSAFGLTALGLYAFVNRLAQVPNFALQIISSGFRPIIYRNYQNEEGQRLARKIFNIFWIMMIPATFIAVVAAKPLIQLLGGEQYEGARQILPYIVVSVLLLGSFYLFGFGYSIKRKTIHVTWISLSVVALLYILSFPLIRLSGLVGVAQASALAAMIGGCLYIFFSERLSPFKYDYRVMFASLIGCISILLLMNN